MTKRKLAAALCALEGRKSQVKMGDMMEVLSRMEDFFAAARLDEQQSYVFEGVAESEMNNRIAALAKKLDKRRKKKARK